MAVLGCRSLVLVIMIIIIIIYYNTLFPVHHPRLFLATASRFITELIFKILRNTYIISELHPCFIGKLVSRIEYSSVHRKV